MRLIGFRFTVLAIGVITALSGVSCNDHSAGAKRAAVSAKPGPEESFETIMEMFRRRMEETPIGFVVSGESTRSTLTGKNEVSHELIKPANAGEPYKAIVTVTSQSRYWIARTKETDDADREKAAKDAAARNDKAATESSDEKTKSFDPAGSAPGDSTRSHLSPIAGDRTALPSSDTDERKYELVYENGRWKLLTELNPETEQSVQNAFNNALETQI
jgi:hypothetical protein